MGELEPYPAMKDSGVEWLGEVPEHWEVLPGRACILEKHEANVGLVEDTVLSLSFGQIVVKAKENLHGLVPESFETYQVVGPGDVICRPTDLQNDKTSLRFGIARNRGIITSAYMCLALQEPLNNRFGHLLLHAYDLKKIFYGLGSGLRQNLSWGDFKYLPCLAPPLAEQAAIVRYLDHVDRRVRRLVRAKRKLIALLEEQKQAIIHRAVTRGLDPDVPMKDSGVEWLGEVPEHWEAARLKDVAVVQTGLTLGKSYRNLATESYPYLRVANVQVGRVDLRNVKRIDVPPTEAARATLAEGDVLMTEGGDIDKLGRGCLWRGEIRGCLHQNHVFAVRCDTRRLEPEFLVALMASQHGRAYFQLTAKQTTNLASTNSSTLRAFPILLAPLTEQRLIIEQLQSRTAVCERAGEDARSEIELLNEYRTRLIADVVTGKLDVRAAAAALPEVDPLDVEDDLDDPLETDADLETELDDPDAVVEEAEA